MFDLLPRTLAHSLFKESIKETTTIPKIDVKEEEGVITISVDVPGFTQDEIMVTITEKNVLSIKAETKETEEDKNKYYKKERSSLFQRNLQLPQRVDKDSIKCRLNSGVLTIEAMNKEQKEEGGITNIPISS